MSSGLPVNLNYSNPTSNGTNVTDLYTYRPNVSGNPVAPASNRAKTSSALTGYLNKAKRFGSPLTGSPFGNAQRNMVVSHAFFQTDLGLHKAFRLWNDSSSFDFRAEAFNVLNKVNYQAPDPNVSNSTFGSITSAYPARQSVCSEAYLLTALITVEFLSSAPWFQSRCRLLTYYYLLLTYFRCNRTML